MLKKLLFLGATMLCACSFFKQDPQLTERDMENDLPDTSADVANDTGRDMGVLDIGRDLTTDTIAVDAGCPADTDECVTGETTACGNLGFDRGTASCNACVWDTSECGTCDYFWSNTGDDQNDGSKTSPFETFGKLNDFTTAGTNGNAVLCLERGSRFDVQDGIAITRSGVTLTAYGDPNDPRPVISGTSITPVAVVGELETHEAPVPNGESVGYVWSGDEWFSTEGLYDGHRADVPNGENAVQFSPADPNAPTFVSPHIAITVTSNQVLSSVAIEEMRFENLGQALSITSLNGDLADIQFRHCDFERVYRAGSVGLAGANWLLDEVLFSNLSVNNSVFGVGFSFIPLETRNVVIENSSFTNPNVLLDPPSGTRSSGVSIGFNGFAIVRNNTFDFSGTEGVPIYFLGAPIPGFGYVPYNGGEAYGNIVRGGNTGVWTNGGNSLPVKIYNNVIDGPATGVLITWSNFQIQVAHNTIVNTTATGLRITPTNSPTAQQEFVNNLIAVNEGYVVTKLGNGLPPNTLFNHNLYFGTAFRSSNTDQSLATWRADTGWDATSTSVGVFPFVDPRPNVIDFTPLVSENLRSSNYPVGDVQTDIFGEPRAATPTIGAIEVP